MSGTAARVSSVLAGVLVGLAAGPAGCGAGHRGDEAAVVRTGDYVFEIGERESRIVALLGPPNVAKDLRNDQPDQMGARYIEYDFRSEVVALSVGGGRHDVSSVIFVLDSTGRVIRITENPNRYGDAASRSLLASPVLADRATIPGDPARRARFP